MKQVASKKEHPQSHRTSGRGQALVEMALLLPILLLLFAGLIELGFSFYDYLVVVNAAREGARYGAKMPDYTDDDVADITMRAAASLSEFVLGEAPDPREVNPGRASVIITRLNAPIPETDEEYTYYIESQRTFGKADLSETEQAALEGPIHKTRLTEGELESVANEVTEALTGVTFMQDAQFIVVEVMYDHSQVIKLFKIGDIIPDPVALSSMTMMRVIASARQQGCPIYPIALDYEALRDANIGDNMDVYEGFEPGNFGWLTWPSESSAGSAGYLDSALQNEYLSMRDYDNPVDPMDHHLNIGDWIHANTGVSGSSDITAGLDALIDQEIRIAVWCDAKPQGSDNPAMYQLCRYAKVRLTSYSLSAKTISAEFLGFDDYCN